MTPYRASTANSSYLPHHAASANTGHHKVRIHRPEGLATGLNQCARRRLALLSPEVLPLDAYKNRDQFIWQK